LLRRAAPAFAVDVEHATLAPLPKRALPRYVVADLVWTAIGIVVFLLVLRAWQDGLPRWSFAAVLLLPTVAIYDWLQFRDTGWALDGDHLLLRWRSAARVTLVTQRRRIQHRSTTANPLQRRAGLVTFHAAVAAGGDGGRYALRHIDRADGDRLLTALSRSARR
jgi:putative membrane protein